MFADANWKALNLKKTRYFVEWNTIDQPGELAKADAFVAAARAAGVSVLMHISTDDINSLPRRPLPSNSAYKTKVGALVQRYRAQGVKDWGVWNEANHKSQPTAKNPKRAADFYKTFRKFKCPGCKIVALDVLDQAGVEKYIGSWIKAAGSVGKKAKIIGVHNYSQVNRRITEKNASSRYPGVARILKAIRKRNSVAKLWLTETGGLASFGSNVQVRPQPPVQPHEVHVRPHQEVRQEHRAPVQLQLLRQRLHAGVRRWSRRGGRHAPCRVQHVQEPAEEHQR